MPKNNKLDCSTITQTKLSNSLKDLMSSETFDKISISNITDNCKMHRQTFYYHFDDKYELLNWTIYNDLINPIINDFSLDTMYEKIETMFETMYSDKKFYQNAIKINSEELSRYINNLAINDLASVVKDVKLSQDFELTEDDDIFVSEFLGYGISGIVFEWAKNGMKETPQVMTRRIEKIVGAFKRVAAERYNED